jgi:homoserine kinase
MKVQVRVPATTANLGPGFDCLGLALELHNRVEMATAGDGLQIAIQGEGADHLPTDESNLVYQAAARLFRHVGTAPDGLRIRLTNEIPLMSGLGSSSAAIVGGLLAANALLDNPLSPGEVLALAVEVEGHPDNVAPALLGGLTVVASDESGPIYRRLAVPSMRVILAVPDLAVPTVQARAALPQQVPLADAVYNIGRAALVVQALTSGDFDLLARVMDDRLHQPYRAHLVPGLAHVFDAAREAGAAGVALSGAGPSVVAFASEQHAAIAQAMQEAFSRHGLTARTLIVPVSQAGAEVSTLPA